MRKKRVKSTRPSGIRGGVNVADKYSTNTPGSKKTRAASSKLGSRGNRMAVQSTNAGTALDVQSTMLYKSYAPTGMIKVGTQSV